MVVNGCFIYYSFLIIEDIDTYILTLYNVKFDQFIFKKKEKHEKTRKKENEKKMDKIFGLG